MTVQAILRRARAPLTQPQLAAASGVSEAHIAKIERGERGYSADVIERIIAVLPVLSPAEEAVLRNHAQVTPSATTISEIRDLTIVVRGLAEQVERLERRVDELEP